MTTEIAVLFGVVAVTFFAAGMVVFAFLRPTVRFVRARIERQAPSFPDRLCAGIWTSAVGAMVISAVSMVRIVNVELVALTWVAVVAWIGIAAGYFLHFTAWRASYVGRETGFAVRYAGALLALGGLVTWLVIALG